MLGAGDLRACLQGGRVSLASRLTLTEGQKIARVYKHKYSVILQLNPGQLNAGFHSKGLETIRKLRRVGGLILPEVFTREKVNPPARVTLAALQTGPKKIFWDSPHLFLA